MENSVDPYPTTPTPDVEQTEPHRRPAWLSFLFEVLQTILMAVVLYFLIDSVIGRVRVENISMQPNLWPGEFILVNKLSYKLGDFRRGDVIVFHYPKNPEEDYIKRVIGLPGEQVSIQNGQIRINGKQLEETYISISVIYNGTWEVPADSIFVLGDNRNQSSDSHTWGFVPKDYVVGRAIVIYWPFKNLKILNETPTVKAAN